MPRLRECAAHTDCHIYCVRITGHTTYLKQCDIQQRLGVFVTPSYFRLYGAGGVLDKMFQGWRLAPHCGAPFESHSGLLFCKYGMSRGLTGRVRIRGRCVVCGRCGLYRDVRNA